MRPATLLKNLWFSLKFFSSVQGTQLSSEALLGNSRRFNFLILTRYRLIESWNFFYMVDDVSFAGSEFHACSLKILRRLVPHFAVLRLRTWKLCVLCCGFQKRLFADVLQKHYWSVESVKDAYKALYTCANDDFMNVFFSYVGSK